MKSKIFALILMVITIMSLYTCVDAGIEYRRPVDNYYSTQNPPDFSWRHTDGAVYDVVVASDYALTDVKYKVDGLRKNIYNFKEKFEPGIYYWSYRVNGGKWQTPYRFYIAENAYEQVMLFDYDNEEEIERVITEKLPSSHPRLYINSKTLSNLKSNEIVYGALWRDVETDIKEGVPATPKAIGELDDLLAMEQSAKSKWFANYHGATGKAAMSALLYLASNDVRYKDFAVAILEEVTSKDEEGNFKWDPRRLFPWYSTTDTYGGMFAENLGYAYDWLYNDLSDELKADIVALMEAACERYYLYHANNGQITGSLYSSMVGSHNYRLNGLTVACLGMYEDSAMARKIVNFHLPVMINYTSAFSYQDGAASMGMFYGIDSDVIQYLGAIDSLGIANLSNKAYVKNHDYRYIYLWDVDQQAVFGDGNSIASKTYQWKLAVQLIAANTKNPYMASVNRWLLNKLTDGAAYTMDKEWASYINAENMRNIIPEEPDLLPASKIFKDAGYASINSAHTDPSKVSLRFKSSTYGSYNHSHPDQNAFVLSAFGENLLIDSDYYYLMGNAFDLAYNRKTWVHNAITYDNGKGQARSNSNASGKITAFTTHPDVDIIKGEAAKAYNYNDSNKAENNLSKADRTIIYLRPDIFIVVDDLVSASGNKSFEFWLNTQGIISTKSTDPSVAVINKNNAYLFADVLYPSVTSQKYPFTQNPDGSYIDSKIITDNLLKGDEPDNRIVFRTPAVNSTKMVTALSVNDENSAPASIYSVTLDGVIKISVKDYTLYINNSGNDTVSCENVTFTGEAVVIRNNTYSLVDGTRLCIDGKEIISSDVDVTVSTDGKSLSLSSVTEDAEVRVLTGKVETIHKTENEKEFFVTPGEMNYGIRYTTDGEYTCFNIYPESYILSLNDTLHEGYVSLGIESNDGGSMFAESTRLRRRDGTEVKIIPDSGYVAEEVLYNGNIVIPDQNGIIRLKNITENSLLSVKFKLIDENTDFKAITYPKIYSEEISNQYIAVNVFGTLSNFSVTPQEYGVIYSYKEEFSYEDINGNDVRKLQANENFPLYNGSFGIKIIDRSENRPEKAYAKAYMIINGECYEGDVICFSLLASAANANISSLSYNSGYMYPEFKSDIYDYVIYSENSDYESFDYVIRETSNAVITPATTIGEKTVITVTSSNGNVKNYSFRVIDKPAYTSYYTTAVSHTYVQSGTSANSVVGATTNSSTGVVSPKAYIYLYNYKTYDSDTAGLLKFDITKINPFAERVFLHLYSYNTAPGKDVGFEVFATEDKYEWTDTTATYNNTLGNGSVKIIKKIGEFKSSAEYFTRTPEYTSGTNRAHLLPEIDITEYAKEAYIAGNQYITLLLKVTDDCWNMGENVTTKSLIIPGKTGGSVFHVKSDVRPRLYWENTEDRKLLTLTHSDGQIYPEFSPDITEYVISSPSSDFKGFSYTVASGSTVSRSYATQVGETTKLTVASKSGKKKVYSFKFIEPKSSEGTVLASNSVYVSGVNKDKVENVTTNSSGVSSPKTFVYLYNYKNSPDTAGILEFDISDISYFADKVALQLTAYNSEIKTVTGYNVYLCESEGALDPLSVTYNNTFGNGKISETKHLAGFTPDSEFLSNPSYQSGTNKRYLLPEIDITKEVKEYIEKGKTKMYFSIRPDESIWNTYDSSTIKSMFIIGVNNSASARYKPNIYWE